ncbi:glutamate-1-semialdehyde aminotransferase [Hyaloraphidium curvatum]|nr:glutamate-1-semialdehyde aminotransferase [Hyaloraphidium curvatum]
MSLDIGAKDAALRERAAKVVPGMLWGHLNVTRYGGGMGGFPQWFTRAEGAKLYDVDGKEYIDLMCAYGPVVLGPNDPDVEKAVDEARTLGPVMTGPSPLLVELSEYIVDLVPHADWCIFLKNGTDATTTCVTIARAQTKKRKVLVAKGAYHGAVPWVSPSLVGVTAEDRAHIITFEWNNIASLEEAAAKAKGDLAGILVSAFQHDLGKDHTMPTPEFAKRCRALCDEAGAALIVDDVRAGMRLHLGGSWELVGVRPDLSAWSKAVANGYPMGFVTGNDKFRQGAASVYVTGSFWCESIGIAACLATLRKLKALDGPEYMRRMGQRLRDGIQKQADERGIPISQSGPPQMPLVLFKDDKFGEWKRGMLWSRVAMKNGAYFHPTHTMFVSVHHTEQDIDRALQASAAGMDAVAKEFGYKAKL